MWKVDDHILKMIHVFDLWDENIAALSPEGIIFYTNKKWNHFAEVNGLDSAEVNKGSNYLEFCEAVSGEQSDDVLHIAKGIRDVIQGKTKIFRFEYPFFRSSKKQWFLLTVIPFSTSVPTPVLVLYLDVTERMHAEEVIRQSEEKFKALYNSMTEGVCLHELVYDEAGNAVDYRILDVNPSYEKILGIKKEEAVNKPASELYGLEEVPYLDIYARVAQTGRPRQFESYFAPMGKYFFISVFSPGKDQFATVFNDITTHKNAENALKDSEARYRSIFETAASLIISVDESGIVKDCNSRISNLLGYERDEIIDQPLSKLIHRDNKGKVQVYLQEILKTGLSYNKEYKMVKKNGECIDILINSSGIGKTNGKFRKIICIINDVTERKKSEERIEYLTSVITSIRNVNQLIVKEKDPVRLIHGICNNLTANQGYNSAWICLFGQDQLPYAVKENGLGDTFDLLLLQIQLGGLPYCAREALDEDHVTIIHKPSEKCRDCLMLPSCKKEAGFLSKLEHSGHIYGVISTSIPAEFAKDKEVAGLFEEVVGDIAFALHNLEMESIHRNTKQSLLESKIAAEEASRTKSEFLANMSHELRTPLNAILGFSQVLESEKYGSLNQKQSRYISNVLKSGRHLLDLINNILDISKIESGNMKFEAEPINLSEVIDETLVFMEPLAREKSIDLVLDIKPENLETYADRMKLKEILANLLSNAIKFTPENGTVGIQSRTRDGQLIVSVSDTGIGISRDKYATIFDSFSQVDSTSRRKYGGTGLGLALVKKYVELHNGEIRVDSEIGEGTTFTFTIPIGGRAQ
jgi:PAS domain S-box-containing protein